MFVRAYSSREKIIFKQQPSIKMALLQNTVIGFIAHTGGLTVAPFTQTDALHQPPHSVFSSQHLPELFNLSVEF